MDEHPAIVKSKDPSLFVARSELALLQGRRLEEADQRLLESICAPKAREPTANWRYGLFVRGAIEIRFGYGSPASVMDTFLVMFGNDARLWGHAWLRDDARPDLLTLVSRELRYASHDPQVWAAVAMGSSDGDQVILELAQRLMRQAEEAFA
jgi:hypothetical protein